MEAFSLIFFLAFGVRLCHITWPTSSLLVGVFGVEVEFDLFFFFLGVFWLTFTRSHCCCLRRAFLIFVLQSVLLFIVVLMVLHELCLAFVKSIFCLKCCVRLLARVNFLTIICLAFLSRCIFLSTARGNRSHYLIQICIFVKNKVKDC